MGRILGVDPGSHATGWGALDETGGTVRYVASGVIRATRGQALPGRLAHIHRGLVAVIADIEPQCVVVENVFTSRNPRSTLVLGQARGAAILAAALAGLDVHEYAPREVKMAVTGNGAAHKSQVAFMLTRILGLAEAPSSEDESDALAVALCHAMRRTTRSPV